MPMPMIDLLTLLICIILLINIIITLVAMHI